MSQRLSGTSLSLRILVTYVCLYLSWVSSALSQTWCGKHYMLGSAVVDPGGRFVEPETSNVPLLALGCAQTIKPYLFDDTAASVLIDTTVTHLRLPNATQFDGDGQPPSSLFLSIVNAETQKVLASGSVPIDTSNFEMPIALVDLQPRLAPYDLTCRAESPTGQVFQISTQFSLLPPNPSGGSTVKIDSRSSVVWAQSTSSQAFEPIIPFGFYTAFSDYLALNLSILDDIKSRGFNAVHPVPTFDNATALELVLDKMESLGLWLIYDMRGSYQDLASVTTQVASITNRSNLLMWYTADEPDGSSDPLNATRLAYDLINQLDGYHPVSLVLNCDNYFFSEYASGADIILQDAYTIGINATFSVEWNTTCTVDFGDCGCDDCVGDLEDISRRVDLIRTFLDESGRKRGTAVWSVPQAFGNQTYWSRFPTGPEFLAQSVLSLNHGARGLTAWIDPTTSDIISSATTFAQSLPALIPFLSSPAVRTDGAALNRVDISAWSLDNSVLLLATNINNATTTVNIDQFVHSPSGMKVVLDGGGTVEIGRSEELTLVMEPLGSVGIIFTV